MSLNIVELEAIDIVLKQMKLDAGSHFLFTKLSYFLNKLPPDNLSEVKYCHNRLK